MISSTIGALISLNYFGSLSSRKTFISPDPDKIVHQFGAVITSACCKDSTKDQSVGQIPTEAPTLPRRSLRNACFGIVHKEQTHVLANVTVKFQSSMSAVPQDV